MKTSHLTSKSERKRAALRIHLRFVIQVSGTLVNDSFALLLVVLFSLPSPATAAPVLQGICGSRVCNAWYSIFCPVAQAFYPGEPLCGFWQQSFRPLPTPFVTSGINEGLQRKTFEQRIIRAHILQSFQAKRSDRSHLSNKC